MKVYCVYHSGNEFLDIIFSSKKKAIEYIKNSNKIFNNKLIKTMPTNEITKIFCSHSHYFYNEQEVN